MAKKDLMEAIYKKFGLKTEFVLVKKLQYKDVALENIEGELVTSSKGKNFLKVNLP